MKNKVIHLLFVAFALIIMSFSTNRKVNIWMIGDSTMAAKNPECDPESGWGVEFKQFVNDKAIVYNHAASGRSTRSFVKEKQWAAVVDSMQPGDFVIIQFGHNDEKPDSLLHTDPYTTYKQFLKKFIDETRAKGGNPIICSSIVRRHFDSTGKLLNTHGDYIKAAREISAETNVPFIDMEASTRKLVSELGSEKSKSLYVFCKPGECPKRPKGVQDSTHLNHDGASQISALFVNEVKSKKIPLSEFLK